MPAIACYLGSINEPIGSDHPRWTDPLPDNRRGRRTVGPALGGNAITYGDYFGAIIDFCSADDWLIVTRAAGRRLERPLHRDQLIGVSVYLEKHGAYYHPARLNVAVGDQTLSFVVNVATSSAGIATLPQEVEALSRLGVRCPFDWLPEVYGSTRMTLADGGEVAMFLGDWFEGYYEFHLTRSTGTDAMVVWDGADSPTLLQATQRAALYRQVAMILTTCYDPLTSDQIHPWHHAAGDFVVRPESDRLSVRLVTVRNYAPLIGPENEIKDEGQLLDAMVMFVIHLTLRMRLDRLDGIGDVVWAPDSSLTPTLDGFTQGLDLTARLSGLPESFPTLFGKYMEHCRPDRLTEMATPLVNAFFQPGSEERSLVGKNLSSHMTLLRYYWTR